MRILLVLFAVAVFAISTVPAQAQGPLTETVLTDLEKRMIRVYYGRQAPSGSGWGGYNPEGDAAAGKGKNKNKNKGMPPGLAKRGGDLPPGLAKKKTLPPGLAKRNLPADLEADLPPRASNLERAVVGNSVVLIDRATNTVLDILENVLVGGGSQ